MSQGKNAARYDDYSYDSLNYKDLLDKLQHKCHIWQNNG
jgi:hypothetical protein